jgi:transcriptional regulator with XRE-family HTH domain
MSVATAPGTDTGSARAERIAWARKAAGFKTKKALADALGVPSKTVERWEKDTAPGAEQLPRLAAVLGVTADWILSGGALEPPTYGPALAEYLGAHPNLPPSDRAWLRSLEPPPPDVSPAAYYGLALNARRELPGISPAAAALAAQFTVRSAKD